jgi:hypothetical protein
MGLDTNNISDNTLKGDDHVNSFTNWILDIDSPVPYGNLRAALDLFPFAFSQLLEFSFQLLIVYIV